MSIVLYEGQSVLSAVEGEEGRGTIVATAGRSGVYVQWTTGPNAGQLLTADAYDLVPVTAELRNDDDDPLHFHAVSSAYKESEEVGVLNFLASNGYTDTWQKIAREVLSYTESAIRTDASMELVEEQLSPSEQRKVVQAAALALLRDAFSDTEV